MDKQIPTLGKNKQTKNKKQNVSIFLINYEASVGILKELIQKLT